MFILNLHGIGAQKREVPPSEQRVWLNETQFLQMLDYVQTRRDVELTFDDANESDVTVALPALQARGLKARFFLVAQRIGQPAFLSADQTRSLLRAGMEIGNHGMRHRPWAGLDVAALQEEIVEARSRLEQLTNSKIDQASCPFGSYNRRVLNSLRRAGYASVYTSDGGATQHDEFVRARNTIYNHWSVETLKQVLAPETALPKAVSRKLKLTLKRWR